MAKPLPSNDTELALYKELSKINQGWVVMWVVLAICIGLTAAILYATFATKDYKVAGINGLLDGLFGWSLKTIVKFHYPSSEPPKAIVPLIKEKVLGSGNE